jgi:predicted secreted protein
MKITSALAIYFILWWLALLVVMPFGTVTQEEAGEVEPGTVPSAPARPMIARRLIAATVLAGIVFAVYYVIWTYELISLDDLPF